jgi:hypothetical protein
LARVSRSSDAVHPLQLICDQGDGAGAIRRIIIHELEVAADDRDGSSQLVPRVVGELPLGGKGTLQPVEHVVERSGQSGHVVVAGYLEPAGKIGRIADPLGGLADHPDWGEHPPGHEPARRPGEPECDERAEAEHPDGIDDLLPVTVVENRHHEVPQARIPCHADGDHGIPDHSRAAVHRPVVRFGRGGKPPSPRC